MALLCQQAQSLTRQDLPKGFRLEPRELEVNEL
ncbi:hypothetical protein XACM_2594 [Xanthomonas euvesicatoria pv. citrumelo F1]|nr:hypothetical protein XACM_2594 [Xanthomonas euvesicatoria pv. citrumelo F1]